MNGATQPLTFISVIQNELPFFINNPSSVFQVSQKSRLTYCRQDTFCLVFSTLVYNFHRCGTYRQRKPMVSMYSHRARFSVTNCITLCRLLSGQFSSFEKWCAFNINTLIKPSFVFILMHLLCRTIIADCLFTTEDHIERQNTVSHVFFFLKAIQHIFTGVI